MHFLNFALYLPVCDPYSYYKCNVYRITQPNILHANRIHMTDVALPKIPGIFLVRLWYKYFGICWQRKIYAAVCTAYEPYS